MNYGAIAASGVSMILVVDTSLLASTPVFANGYEKGKVISQVNECGNYWFRQI